MSRGSCFSPHASRAAGAATPQNPGRRRRLGSGRLISTLDCTYVRRHQGSAVGACPRCCLTNTVCCRAGGSSRGQHLWRGRACLIRGGPPGEPPGKAGSGLTSFTPVLYAWTLLFKRGAWLGVPAAPPQSPFRIRRVLWMLARDTPHPSWVSSSNHQPQADFAWGACYYYLLTCRQGLPALHAQKLRGARGAVFCTSLPG